MHIIRRYKSKFLILSRKKSFRMAFGIILISGILFGSYVIGYEAGQASDNSSVFDNGWRYGYQKGYANGKSDGIKILQRITIHPGLNSSTVAGRLGTPEKVTKYEYLDSYNNKMIGSMWTYPEIEIYFDFNGNVSSWEGPVADFLRKELGLVSDDIVLREELRKHGLALESDVQ